MNNVKSIDMAPPDGFLEEVERLFEDFLSPETVQEEPKADKTNPNNLDAALSQFGENDPKSYTKFNAKHAPKRKFTVVEKALAEETLLKHGSRTVRQGAADDLVELAQDEDTTIPTVCRIRDMLAFWNQKQGGEEFAPQLRLVKKVLSIKHTAFEAAKVREAEELRKFETRKTPPYAPDTPKNQPRKAVIITKPNLIVR